MVKKAGPFVLIAPVLAFLFPYTPASLIPLFILNIIFDGAKTLPMRIYNAFIFSVIIGLHTYLVFGLALGYLLNISVGFSMILAYSAFFVIYGGFVDHNEYGTMMTIFVHLMWGRYLNIGEIYKDWIYGDEIDRDEVCGDGIYGDEIGDGIHGDDIYGEPARMLSTSGQIYGDGKNLRP